MGYALFANRKLMLTNTINTLQLKLDAIMQQRNELLEFSASIADGYVTAEEMASNASNMPYYENYFMGLDQYGSSDQVNEASGRVADQARNELGENSNDMAEQAYLMNIQSLFDQEVREKYAQAEMRKIAVQENKLDMQQKKIETQLTAAQSQLQAVEQAEGKAIENATPKFAGVG